MQLLHFLLLGATIAVTYAKTSPIKPADIEYFAGKCGKGGEKKTLDKVDCYNLDAGCVAVMKVDREWLVQAYTKKGCSGKEIGSPGVNEDNGELSGKIKSVRYYRWAQ